MDDMTARTPSLDPERVGAAAEAAVRADAAETDYLAEDDYDALARAVLAADDAHARSRGLVATGDGLTREALAGLTVVARFVHGEPGWCYCVALLNPPCMTCTAKAALAALPPSLLDTTEDDQ